MAAGSIYGSEGVGYIDGEFYPLGELRMPVTDLGFQLADMCYDAIHVWDGKFFRLDDHLDRWDRSIAARKYDTLDQDRDGFADVMHGCVARAGLERSMVTLLATRGTPLTPYKDLRNCKNRLIAWAAPYYSVVSDEETEKGCEIVIAETVRIPPESVDPTVKNFGRLDFVSAMFEAYERDASHALLLDADGHVTEGRGWNLFALKGGELVSPDRGVLEGITRMTVLELAARLNIEARLGRLKADDLVATDEIFMSSTAGGLIPVIGLDGETVGDGQAGPVTERLREMYWGLHEDDAYTTPVKYEMAG